MYFLYPNLKLNINEEHHKMKIRLINIWLIGLFFALQACESSMPVFSESGCEIRFDSVGVAVTKSFVYDGPDVKEGIAYVTVQAVGFVKDYDRPFQVQQIKTKEKEELKDAVAGVHFVPFEDKIFQMPAEQSEVKIPVTILNDTSLDRNRFVLRLELVANEYFSTDMTGKETDGEAVKDIHKDIVITNLLTEPGNWHWKFGTYGPVKHQFMIDVTEKKWDEAFFKELSANYSYLLFMYDIVKKELQTENERRKKEGLDVLREDPEPGQVEGIEVIF